MNGTTSLGLKIGGCLAALVLAASAAGAPSVPVCPAERAVYEMRSESAIFRIGFVPARNFASVASDLYLKLVTPQHEYWLKFGMANGHGGISVLPISDPYAPAGPKDLIGGADDASLLASLRFYALDHDLNFLPEPPRSGEEAPPYLMVPELGAVLWNAPFALSPEPAPDPVVLPRGVFKRVACLVAPPPRANP